MNPQDPLAELMPLREPPPVEWWPPAPGWWLLLAALLLVVAAGIYAWARHRRRTAYRRQALQHLRALQAAHQATENHSGHLGDINALLKRVALIAFPDKGVAQLHGEDWQSFLNRSAANQPPFSSEIASAHYRGTGDARAAREAHRCAAHWIAHHEVARD